MGGAAERLSKAIGYEVNVSDPESAYLLAAVCIERLQDQVERAAQILQEPGRTKIEKATDGKPVRFDIGQEG